MTPAEQVREMGDRIVAESLADVRREAALRDWDGMESDMALRVPALCDDAAAAAEWGRERLGLILLLRAA